MKNKERNAFERVLLARHPERPYTMDLIQTIFTDFVELHGDRRYSDDAAIICGFAKFENFEVAVIGQQKGRDINQRRIRNFGMPKPEGYRKAIRVMKTAEKFGRPVITFVDTPGAYPGIDAEERGQAEAIAYNLREMALLKVPVIVVILGEGGSGGALAIAVGDKILMLENAVYSVITPEGCAAILWKDAAKANLAAENLGLTSVDLQKLNLVDEIIEEPVEWKSSKDEDNPHKNFDITTEVLKKALSKYLNNLKNADIEQILQLRFKKFRSMGMWV
jgi:acetyl-CoA carboxylase carboxyl transferase subunit alpha